MEYECQQCGMGVKGLTCSKCGKHLVSKTVMVNNKEVQVAECPSGCGRIKSPMCCGQDMQSHS